MHTDKICVIIYCCSPISFSPSWDHHQSVTKEYKQHKIHNIRYRVTQEYKQYRIYDIPSHNNTNNIQYTVIQEYKQYTIYDTRYTVTQEYKQYRIYGIQSHNNTNKIQYTIYDIESHKNTNNIQYTIYDIQSHKTTKNISYTIYDTQSHKNTNNKLYFSIVCIFLRLYILHCILFVSFCDTLMKVVGTNETCRSAVIPIWCTFVGLLHTCKIFIARMWNIHVVFQDVAKVDGPMTHCEFLRRKDMQFLYEGYKQEVS